MGDKLKSKKIQLELSQHVWRSLEMNHKKIILEKKRLNSSLPAIQAFFFFFFCCTSCLFSSQANRRPWQPWLLFFLRPFVHGCFNRSQDQDQGQGEKKRKTCRGPWSGLVWYHLEMDDKRTPHPSLVGSTGPIDGKRRRK